MNKEHHSRPKRAKYDCRRPASRPDLLIGNDDAAARATKLRAAIDSNAPEHIIKAHAYGWNRISIMAHGQGLVTTQAAADDASWRREVAESGGSRDPQLVTTEALFLFQDRAYRTPEELRDSKERLNSMAVRLKKKIDADGAGAISASFAWDAALVFGACARIADPIHGWGDARGYARRAIGLTWQEHPRACSLYVELQRRILFDCGETVLAAGLPRMSRVDLGYNPVLDHYMIAPSLWSS